MTEHDVALGVADPALAGALTALLREAGGFADAGTARTTTEVRRLVERTAPVVVVLDEHLGPLPALELVRELGVSHPGTSVVLAAREPSRRFVQSAMEAGARAVVTLPASLEGLQTRLTAAAALATAVRSRQEPARGEVAACPSRIVTVAAARGGAGATSVAVLLALAAAQESSVCLVDLDLQAGDVPAHLGAVPARTLHDLVEVADDLTSRAVQDSLFRHPEGLSVLFAPEHGEQGEDVSAALVRGVLGILASRFDVVVVDVGATATEGSVTAVEMAHDVLVVVTPDVPALRAARRLTGLWQRLEICKPDDVRVVVNRSSRRDEVRSGLVRQLTGTDVTRSVLPARYRRMEPWLNAGPPERPSRHPLWRPAVGLARELGLAATPATRRARAAQALRGRRAGTAERPAGTDRPAPARASRDEGMGLLEHMVSVLLMGVLTVVTVQSVVLLLSGVFATHAADRGARRLAVVAPYHPEGRRAVETAATQDLPDLWRRSAVVRVEGDEVSVTLRVPGLLGAGFLDVAPFETVTMSERTVREWR